VSVCNATHYFFDAFALCRRCAQSETIIVTVPQLNVARTGILDYWHDVAPAQAIMSFNDALTCDEITGQFLAQCCATMAFPIGADILPTYLSGESWLLLKNFPEVSVPLRYKCGVP